MCKNSGFRSRIQKSYKKFGIESKNLIIFSESTPNLLPLCLPLPHTDRTDLRLSLWVKNLMDGQTLPNPPLGRAYQLLNIRLIERK